MAKSQSLLALSKQLGAAKRKLKTSHLVKGALVSGGHADLLLTHGAKLKIHSKKTRNAAAYKKLKGLNLTAIKTPYRNVFMTHVKSDLALTPGQLHWQFGNDKYDTRRSAMAALRKKHASTLNALRPKRAKKAKKPENTISGINLKQYKSSEDPDYMP
jgi:hypothetical protein